MNRLLETEKNHQSDRMKITRNTRVPFSDLPVNSIKNCPSDKKKSYIFLNLLQPLNDNEKDEEIFINARQFFMHLDLQNLSIQKNPQIEEIRKTFPIINSNFLQSNQNKNNKSSHNQLDPLVCFNETYNDHNYIKDDYLNILTNELKYAQQENYLRKMIKQKERISIINWLISVQQFLNLSEISLHQTVRLFDRILIEDKTNLTNYQLKGIVSLWISNKLINYNTITVSKIHAICDSNYTRQEIIECELKILQMIKFDLYQIEPLTILYYYFTFLGLEQAKDLFIYGQFLLECSLLFIEYSALYPTIIAATIVCLILKKFQIDCGNFLEFIDNHLLPKRELVQLSNRFERRFNFIKETQLCPEIIRKYSRDVYLNVANL